MDIKVLFNDLVKGKNPENKFGGTMTADKDKMLASFVKNLGDNAAFRNFDNTYNLLFEKNLTENLPKSKIFTDKFYYDMFENCEDLYELNLIKEYHIGENPIDDDCYWVLGDIELLSGKFGKYLLFCFVD